MRRGHPGIGGWRNESPRHFRPRGGGIPRYGYPQQYPPRLNLRAEFGLQRLGPRPHRGGLHYHVHTGPPPIEHFQHDHDRYVFRRSQPPRLLDRDNRGDRHSFPQPPPMRQNDNSEDASRYNHILNHCRINNMGDIDHRQNFNMIESPYKQYPVHQWPNTFQTESTSFDDRLSYKKPNRYHDNAEGNQFPTSTGHRPPSSDHYGGNVASAIDNSNSFSRSVDDTVDIVRKRLLNRNEPHNVADIPPVQQNPNGPADIPAIAPLYQNVPQTPPARKKTQRRQNVKSNCDKIKNKIVHQLFKMDKEKIHKLMDNPNSSTKFEYAISSLITESQNSLDRHLRSVAEKSLCRSSEEFICNDSNTIYEDTFLKQMQCILEPQDTVLLEDIKPLVMAELTKVLQLDEFEQRFDLSEEDRHFYPAEEHPSMNYPNQHETLANEDFSKDTSVPDFGKDQIAYYQEQSYSQSQFATQQTPKCPTGNFSHKQPLYEQRIIRESDNANVPIQESIEDCKSPKKIADRECYKFSDKRRISETTVPELDHGQARKSFESEHYKFSDERRICETSVPVFDHEKARKSSESEHYKFRNERRMSTTSVQVFDHERALERRISETSVPVFDHEKPHERRISEKSVPVFDREKPHERRISETSVPVFDLEKPHERRISETSVPVFDREKSHERRISETSVPVFDREKPHERRISETSVPVFDREKSHERCISETSVPVFDREKPHERRISETSFPVFDHEKARKSADRERIKYDERRKCKTSVPVFNAEPDPYQLSEEEDQFADLDKQYHVPVDHSFIDEELDKQFMAANQIAGKYEIEIKSEKETEQIVNQEILPYSQIMNTTTVKKEIDSQILSIAKSPLKLCSLYNKDKENHQNTPLLSVSVKNEVHDISYDDPSENQNYDINNMDNSYQDQTPEFNNEQRKSKRSLHSNSVKSSILSNARKRSIDQKPSHRKEKRKKSEITPGEANKQILNKNIIINVNDCGSKSTEKKCDSAKSIFNLFFSKDESGKELPRDNKNVELSHKGYSDKYVKRKETPKKNDHDSKRNRSSSTSHSIVNSKENNISCSETSSKDAKNKLKPIDMFVDHPKKVPSTHQAHRNTAQAMTPKKVDDKTPVLGPKSKTSPPKRHIATQVVIKVHSKETQTSLLKSSVSKLCQTETKKLLVKATQTNPVTFEKSGIKSTDNFERMKEIDLEIQVLLQEKFKIYSSLESRESCSNAMHNLGMTVLNVTRIEEKDEVGNEDSVPADSIVDPFTSIPVEELEQIVLESEQEITIESPKVQKRNRRQKVLNKTKPKLQSPIPVINIKNKKKSNPPNISLIEQIITDDRPLEDIISLEDLERSEDKQSNATKRKRPQRPQRTKKKSAKKSRAVKPSNDLDQLNIRECSVVLKREDVSTYFNINNSIKSEQPSQKYTTATLVQESSIEKTDLAEISISNESADIQFDMLDVSEDIVIGTVCEVKSSGEKDGSGRDLSTSDDLILDNSQSSADDAVPADAGQSGECRMFDYSADEMLRRDSVTVTGNADAVLAIECIENNFIAACLDGNVYHFNGDGQLLATLRGSNLAVTCLTIVREKYGITIYTGSLDSRIRYYDLDTGLEKGPECNVLSPIQTMDRAWDTVFVGTRTGFVLQFECKNNMLIPISTVKFSEQSILALRALKEGPRKVLLVAARSENVTIKDAQTGLLLRTLEGPKMTVYTLLFEDGKVYCGTSSNQIHTFDYASGSHCGTHEGGKGCVCLRATGGLLFAGCYDGCVYVFREGEPRPFAQLRGPGLMLLSLAVVGTKIIAGYKDRSLYIWKIPLSILREMIL